MKILIFLFMRRHFTMFKLEKKFGGARAHRDKEKVRHS